MDIGPETNVESDRTIRRLLFGGEDVIREVTVGSAHFAVTTHRLIVYDPEADGRRFEYAYHPNIVDITVDTTGSTGYASWLPRIVVYGVVSLGGGWLVKTTALPLLDRSLPSASTQLVGGVTRTLGLIASGLESLATLLIVVGVAMLGGAAWLAAMDRVSRRSAVVVARAGSEPIEYPVAKAEGRRIAAELTTALESVRGRDD